MHNVLNEINITTSKNEKFILENDPNEGIIIISCESNLKFLGESAEEIFLDGTFKCCPKFFYQLYTVHGMKNGHVIPLIYVLMSGAQIMLLNHSMLIITPNSMVIILIFIFFLMLFKNNNLYHMLNCYQQILLHLNAKLIKKELNTKRLNMINFYVKKLICSHIWNHWVILSMLYWKSININCKFILCLFIYTYFISFYYS